MTQRNPRARAFSPDPAAPDRCCDMPSCTAAGGYRAPKSRTSLSEYHWFCLEHVRAYNASWDFYKGMTPAQIEAQTRSDTGWQRPTWPLGSLGKQAAIDEAMVRDPFNILHAQRAPSRPSPAAIPAEVRESMHTLGLDWPASIDVVKARYKELAKRHHPDANGGDRASEERLKTINIAYAAVRHYLTIEPRMAATG